MPPERTVSVVIPARDEVATIGRLVEAVSPSVRPAPRSSCSLWMTARETEPPTPPGAPEPAFSCSSAGSKAATRPQLETGVLPSPPATLWCSSTPIALPADNWLRRMLEAHDSGAIVVGGSLAMPPGLPLSARCDYYCGWYHVHERQPAGEVPNHPPSNLSVRQAAFARTGGFTERMPIAYAHEELEWQAELIRSGARIWFEPAAIVTHRNRPGFKTSCVATTAGATARSRSRARLALCASRGSTAGRGC